MNDRPIVGKETIIFSLFCCALERLGSPPPRTRRDKHVPQVQGNPGGRKETAFSESASKRAFAGGLKSLNQCAANTPTAAYRGAVCELIDVFSHHMTKHSADEIDTL